MKWDVCWYSRQAAPVGGGTIQGGVVGQPWQGGTAGSGLGVFGPAGGGGPSGAGSGGAGGSGGGGGGGAGGGPPGGGGGGGKPPLKDKKVNDRWHRERNEDFDVAELAGGVQRLHDQIAKVLDGRVDGYNVAPDFAGDGLAFSPQTKTAAKVLKSTVADTTASAYVRKKGTVFQADAAKPGIEFVVDAADATNGRVCVVDRNNLAGGQKASIIPDSGTSSPGATWKTPRGAFTIDTGGAFNVVVKRNGTTKITVGASVTTHAQPITIPGSSGSNNERFGNASDVTGDSSVAVGANASVVGSQGIGIGYGVLVPDIGSIVIGSTDATSTSSNQFIAGSNSAPIADVYFGTGVQTTATHGQAYSIHGTDGNGSNKNGGSVTLSGGKGTGSGTPGALLFKTSTAAGSSSTLQTLSTRLTIDGTGRATFANDFAVNFGTANKFIFAGVPASSDKTITFQNVTGTVALSADLAAYALLTANNFSGLQSVKAGTASSLQANVGGCIKGSSSTVGNVGAGEDDLHSTTVSANTLGSTNDSIYMIAAGTFATSLANKRIRVKFGATTLLDTGALAITTAADWCIECHIIRTGSAAYKAVTKITSSSSALVASDDYVTGTDDLTTGLTLKITGEATNDNDVVQELSKVYWEPAPPS